MEIKTKPRVFHYTVGLAWSGQRRGIITADAKPRLEVATPPEFRGHPGTWTPEDLLVAAVNTCTMTTFLAFAARKEIDLVSYESEATGTMELIDGHLRFTKILVRPRVVVGSPEDRQKALAVFLEAEVACPVSNALIPEVKTEPEIAARD